MTRTAFRSALLVAALLFAAAPAWACPSCKDGSSKETNGAAVMRAYELSIYGMMSMPFVLGGTIGFLLWRSEKSRKMRRAAAAGLVDSDATSSTQP
jgi:hypothetical protein